MTESQRRTLVALIAARPGDTCDEIRLAFENQTGRRLTRSWAWKISKDGYKPPGSGTRGGQGLTPLQRATLEGLCLQATSTDSTAAIAERFEQRTGRKVAPGTVSSYRYMLGISIKKGGAR